MIVMLFFCLFFMETTQQKEKKKNIYIYAFFEQYYIFYYYKGRLFIFFDINIHTHTFNLFLIESDFLFVLLRTNTFSLVVTKATSF